MSPHLLWAEAPEKVNPGTSGQVYCFFGHPSNTEGFFAPKMNALYLVDPYGKRINLNATRRNWVPGYGSVPFWFAKAEWTESGIYHFMAERSPGVYDIGWHGGESAPFLSYNYAMVTIQSGRNTTGHLPMKTPITLTSEENLQKAISGDDVYFTVRYQGEPVQADFNASYWIWDESGHPDIQRGKTNGNGQFNVRLTKAGLWLIDAAWAVPQTGSWTATYSLGDFFNEGDLLEYNTIRHKITLSLWVGLS
jgi:hypothetical protein